MVDTLTINQGQRYMDQYGTTIYLLSETYSFYVYADDLKKILYSKKAVNLNVRENFIKALEVAIDELPLTYKELIISKFIDAQAIVDGLYGLSIEQASFQSQIKTIQSEMGEIDAYDPAFEEVRKVFNKYLSQLYFIDEQLIPWTGTGAEFEGNNRIASFGANITGDDIRNNIELMFPNCAIDEDSSVFDGVSEFVIPGYDNAYFYHKNGEAETLLINNQIYYHYIDKSRKMSYWNHVFNYEIAS